MTEQVHTVVEAQVHVDVDEVTEAKVAEAIDVVAIVSGTTLRVLEITHNTASHPNRTGRMTSFAINVVAVDTFVTNVLRIEPTNHAIVKATCSTAIIVTYLARPITRAIKQAPLLLSPELSMPSKRMRHHLQHQPPQCKRKVPTTSSSLTRSLVTIITTIKPTPLTYLHRVQCTRRLHLLNVYS